MHNPGPCIQGFCNQNERNSFAMFGGFSQIRRAILSSYNESVWWVSRVPPFPIPTLLVTPLPLAACGGVWVNVLVSRVRVVVCTGGRTGILIYYEEMINY